MPSSLTFFPFYLNSVAKLSSNVSPSNINGSTSSSFGRLLASGFSWDPFTVFTLFAESLSIRSNEDEVSQNGLQQRCRGPIDESYVPYGIWNFMCSKDNFCQFSLKGCCQGIKLRCWDNQRHNNMYNNPSSLLLLFSPCSQSSLYLVKPTLLVCILWHIDY